MNRRKLEDWVLVLAVASMVAPYVLAVTLILRAL